MIEFPKSKINLGLRILNKRPDGYHDIETIFYPVNLCDALEFVVSQDPLNEDSLTITGIPNMDPNDNLVIKALKILRSKYKFPLLKIHLHKGIPLGAGLGGGSSDAAYFLKAVNKGFRLNIPVDELKSFALQAGSDSPFFIDCQPAYATGRGEILSPVNEVLKGYYLILLNPGVSISTREAYQNCIPRRQTGNLAELILNPISGWRELISNDFEDFAIKKFPLIGQIKNDMYNSGALFSLMSGSGSSLYGIFNEKPQNIDGIKKYIIFEGKM